MEVHRATRGPQKNYESQRARTVHLTHHIYLEQMAPEIDRHFRSSTSKNIRKAIKEGVVVHRSSSLASVREFYKLNCITRKRHGLPPQPARFFKNIHKWIISKRMGFVKQAYLGNVLIAGAVFFDFKGTFLYKFGASDPRYQNKRPNNLVMWKPIQWAYENGCQLFDFRRTATGNAGLAQFKRGWASHKIVLQYYRINPRTQHFYQAASQPRGSYPFLKKLPIPLLELTGKVLYRHAG